MSSQQDTMTPVEIPMSVHRIDSDTPQSDQANEKNEESINSYTTGTTSGYDVLTWKQFTCNTTFHGIKYIFSGTFKLRKLAWTLFVLASIGVFVSQVGQGILLFSQRQTNVDIKVEYPDKTAFPAVTFCNQNSYRASVAVKFGMYHFLDSIYGSSISSVNTTTYELEDVDTRVFLTEASHQLDDFVVSCTWKGEACNISRDFSPTITDMGVCYTFNGHQSQPFIVTESGSSFGLSLTLNIEQYEYMRGPQTDAGIQMLLHDQGEFPLMKDLGFAVSPGTHTLIGVERSEVISLESPYGKCNTSNTQPIANCQVLCRTQMLVAGCDCRDIYMDDTSNATLCSMKKQFGCVRTQTVEIMKKLSGCECTAPCHQIIYQPRMSHSQLSKFSIESVVLIDEDQRARVQNKFLNTMELNQRLRTDIVKADKERLQHFREQLHMLWTDVKFMNDAMQTDKTFAEAYGVVRIIENLDDMIRADLYLIKDRLVDTTTLLSPILKTKMDYLDKFLTTVMHNLLAFDIEKRQSGFHQKMLGCMHNFTFPLAGFPENIYAYFNGHGRVKRSHKADNAIITDFYDMIAPEYMKVNSVEDCNDYLYWKQELAMTLAEQREEMETDRKHVHTIKLAFENFIRVMYRNTSKVPTDMPKYQQCVNVLEHLNSTLWDDLDRFAVTLYAFASAHDTAGAMAAMGDVLDIFTSTSLANNAAYTITGKLYMNCYWPYLEYLSADHGGKDYEQFLSYYFELRKAYLAYPTVQVSFANLQEYIGKLYHVIDTSIMPSLSVATDIYFVGGITKLDLSNVFTSRYMSISINDLAVLAADFSSVSREFEDQRTEALKNVMAGIAHISNTSFPIVDNELFFHWETIEHFKTSNVSRVTRITDKFTLNTSLNTKLFIDALEIIDQDYRDIVSAMRYNIARRIDAVQKNFTITQSILATYGKDCIMNKKFFMENFLQIDVFYKILNYKVITAHETFPLLRLLGDVGGFLGLLLGASALTIIEILDALVVAAIKLCRRGCPVKKRL